MPGWTLQGSRHREVQNPVVRRDYLDESFKRHSRKYLLILETAGSGSKAVEGGVNCHWHLYPTRSIMPGQSNLEKEQIAEYQAEEE
jgi:hypothetical protein